MSAKNLRRKLWLGGCLIAAGGIWGLVPSLAKLATAEGVNALGATFWQALAGGLLLLGITVSRGRRLYLSRHHIVFYFICGFTGTTIPTAIIFVAAGELTAGLISILIALTPIATYAILLFMGREVFLPVRLLGILLGLVAVVLLVFPGANVGVQAAPLWIAIALCVPLLYATENVVISVKRPPYSDEISLVAGMLLSSSLVLAPVIFLTDNFQPLTVRHDTGQLAILGIATFNVISYVLFLYLVRIAGAVYAAQAGYWSMLLGVAWGMALWDETHTSWVWLAMLLMLGGMFLVKEHSLPAAPVAPHKSP